MAKDDKKEVKKIENKEDKLKALDAAISHIEKQYGKGSVMKLGESAKTMNVDAVPTGCLSLDIALGIGGLPKGRVIEVKPVKNAVSNPAIIFLFIKSSSFVCLYFTPFYSKIPEKQSEISLKFL